MSADKSPVFDSASAGSGPQSGSSRTFGLFFGALFGALGAWGVWRGTSWAWTAVGAGGVITALALAAPGVLRPANRAWFALGMMLARVVNPVVIGIMFFAVITPMGLLMRLVGKRPLSLHRDPASTTYWIARQPPGPAPESMRDQF